MLERFHQTLKTLSRAYCLEFEKDWEEGVHMQMFAIREVVQESLGFSPSHLVFDQCAWALEAFEGKWPCEGTEHIFEAHMVEYVYRYNTR